MVCGDSARHPYPLGLTSNRAERDRGASPPPRHNIGSRGLLPGARVRSGRLGGRPKKISRDEARAAALEELVPSAIRSLQNHLGDGDPASWRAALRVFELAFGPPPEPDGEPAIPTSADEVARLGWRELQLLAARVLVEPTGTERRAVPIGSGGTEM